MLPLLAVLLGLSVLCGLPLDVIGKCSMNMQGPLPLTITSFGSKNFVKPIEGVYESEEGGEIQLYCGGGFDLKYSSSCHGCGTSSTTIPDTRGTLRCRNSWFAFNGLDLYGGHIHCLSRPIQMFESKKSLPNCGKDMSLVLGMDFAEIGSVKNAALCYDILGSKLKYLSYTTFSSKNRIVEKTQVGQLNELGLDIKVTYSSSLIRSISQSDIDSYMLAEKQVASLFVDNAFEYASLTQDQQLVGYEDMLGTVWLRVLRSGNWAHWLSALRVASDAGAHFDVRMGVSGTLELPVPAVGHCNESRSLVIGLKDGSSMPVPAHIWAHVRALQSTGGDEDEFVLIGHNSPFFRSDNSSALCSSMCDQVSWLRSSLFASLNEFPAYGLVQCCRVEDVAQKLDNFPGAFVDAAATTTSTAVTTTTEAATTTTTTAAPLRQLFWEDDYNNDYNPELE